MTWPMAGQGPQRGSYSNQAAIIGPMPDSAVQPFESYIGYGMQLVADSVLGLIYVPHQHGLTALADSSVMDEQWTFATSMPAGHSPTADEANGLVYFPCTNKKLYCIDATDGSKVWEFSALSQTPLGSGWRTNPIVYGGYVYAGNDDGHFYCLDASDGSFVWKTMNTGASIRFSPAMNVAGTMMFFANQDGTAYGIDMSDGSVTWSVSLPSSVFDTYWPVIYGSNVIFCGGYNARESIPPGPASHFIERESAPGGFLFPDGLSGDNNKSISPAGTDAGDWHTGANTIDFSQKNPSFTGTVALIPEYLEDNPERRSVFVLDQATGAEFTYSYTRQDASTGTSYAPYTWQGTHAGCRPPGMVAYDGVYYNLITYKQTASIARASVFGWKDGTTIFRNIGREYASDEPVVLSGTGNGVTQELLFARLSCDRELAGHQLNMAGLPTRWETFRYQPPYDPDSIEDRVPNYNPGYVNGDYSILERKHLAYHGSDAVAGQYMDGVYGIHGAQNPPIFCNGAVYLHAGNSVIRYASGGSYSGTPNTIIAKPTPVETPALTTAGAIQSELEAQVSAMVSAGHLRPGFVSSGYIEGILNPDYDRFFDYFAGPWETVITLLAARPHLSTGLQTSVDSYLADNYGPGSPYDFTVYCHAGWVGSAREVCPLLPEISSALAGFGKKTAAPTSQQEDIWTFNPLVFYAALKYCTQYGGTSTVVSALEGNTTIMNQLNPAYGLYPPDLGVITGLNFTVGFSTHPWVLNAYLAGYYGYIQLKILNSETASSTITDEYTRLLALRVSQWEQDSPWVLNTSPNGEGYYNQRALNGNAQWLYLVPEIAAHIRTNLSTEADACIAHYEDLMPYWFSPKADVTFGEGQVAMLYDTWALFKAKAWVQELTFDELVPYIQAPAVKTGDLFYISNLTDAMNVAATTAQFGTVSIDDATPDLYAKVTLSIDAITTVATDYQWPYDAAPPANVVQDNGITVDLVVTTPGSVTKRQPFYYKGITIDGSLDPVTDGQWYCHISPDEAGTWTYYVEVTDASGTVTTATAQFVTSATPANKGAIVQSANDSRYWEYQDGDLFVPAGPNLEYNDTVNSWANPVSGPAAKMSELADCNMIRMFLPMWMIQGAQEHLWLHGHRVSPSSATDPALRFEGQADTSYDDGSFTTTTDHVLLSYDNHGAAIRFTDEEKGIRVNRTQFVRVKPSTDYRVFIRYAIPVELVGPADATNIYGISLKYTQNVWADGNGTPLYYDYNTGTRLWGPFYQSTGLDGSDNVQWVEEVDTFTTGASQTNLTHLYLTHENVTTLDGHDEATPHWTNLVYIDEIRIEEDLGSGNYGPNVLTQDSFNLVDKFNEIMAARFDLFLAAAETAGMTIKLTINEKQEPIFYNLNPATGQYVDWDSKNYAFFYGDSGEDWTVQSNKTRWLQAGWWRYVQARWGYSPAIHSWELLNEGSGNPGDGVDDIHYHLAAIFADKMTYAPDDNEWVNIHPVTTSFNQHMAFPKTNLYQDVTKPGSDKIYGDTHNYTYQNTETAQYNDELVDYAAMVTALPALNTPKMQGEFAFSAVSGNETPDYALLNQDTDGTWHRNRLWAMMFSPEPIFFQIWYYTNTIKNGTVDHLHHYGDIQTFFADIPLHNGNYVDAAATTDMAAGGYAVYGQKDLTANRAHLFVRADGSTPATWLNKANAASITACTGDIVIVGLVDGNYTVEAIDPDDGTTVLDTATVTASSGLTITPGDFAVLSGLQDAVLFKITTTGQVAPAAPSGLQAVRA